MGCPPECVNSGGLIFLWGSFCLLPDIGGQLVGENRKCFVAGAVALDEKICYIDKKAKGEGYNEDF